MRRFILSFGVIALVASCGSTSSSIDGNGLREYVTSEFADPKLAKQFEEEIIKVCKFPEKDFADTIEVLAQDESPTLRVKFLKAFNAGCSERLLAALRERGYSSQITDGCGVLYRVTYRVSGTADNASITLQGENGVQQFGSVSTPWAMTACLKGTSSPYISAQNLDSSGSISCAIEINERQVAQNSSSGGYTIATCQP